MSPIHLSITHFFFLIDQEKMAHWISNKAKGKNLESRGTFLLWLTDLLALQ